MPRETDYSDHPETLPRPELSPTLNPVLGQNMGRWAEVYFKSPPERREAAVLELLRTLEAESPERELTEAAPLLVAEHTPASQNSFKSQVATDAPSLLECPSCGGQNPSQRFCGMCGARLDALAESDPPMDEAPPMMPASQGARWESQSFSHEPTVEPRLTADAFFPVLDRSDRDWNDHVPNRSLFYIGGVLAVLIMVVAYIAWRGAHATPATSQGAAQPPSVATTQQAAPVSTPSTPKVLPPEPSSNVTGTANEETTQGVADKATPTATIANHADTKIAQPPVISGGGSEELATAQRYLNGSEGQQPDTAAAVDWLWKAVAKRNIEATLLLSDLFLKGHGVPQNCDQGRVLLDAAASRGSKDAAIRLRHLQAFGCQ